jgi:hypothetical protein
MATVRMPISAGGAHDADGDFAAVGDEQAALRAAGHQRPRAVEGARRVVDAEAHLGAESQSRRHGGAHGGGDVMKQFRLVEQRRAAAMAVHQRRRAAEVEVDAGRREFGQARGVLGETRGIGAHQLHPHRRAGCGARAIQQLRADAGEALPRQQGAGDAHELGNAPVVAPRARQHAAQDVVGEALHGGEDEAGHFERSSSPRKRGSMSMKKTLDSRVRGNDDQA